jgi:hypothetical protein
VSLNLLLVTTNYFVFLSVTRRNIRTLAPSGNGGRREIDLQPLSGAARVLIPGEMPLAHFIGDHLTNAELPVPAVTPPLVLNGPGLPGL